jgi:hypothetical protein
MPHIWSVAAAVSSVSRAIGSYQSDFRAGGPVVSFEEVWIRRPHANQQPGLDAKKMVDDSDADE